MDKLVESVSYIQSTIAQSLPYLLQLSVFLLAILTLNYAIRGWLGLLGIIPRKFYGLPGILFAPFIHANFNHLFFNLIPMLILSDMLMLYGFDFYWQISWLLILFSGVLIWLFARPGIHIGASALVTAYWGFLVCNSIFDSSHVINLVIGFICIYYFIGIFIGIFPSQDRVSWEGHLMGLISGVTLYLLGYYIPYFHQLFFEAPYRIPPPSFVEKPF